MSCKHAAHDFILWAALPMARTAQVESRLHMILKPNANRRTLTRRAVVGSLFIAALGVGTLAALKPEARAQAVVPPPGDVKTLRYEVTEIGPSAELSPQYFLTNTGTVAGQVYEPKPRRLWPLQAFMMPPGQPRLLVKAAPGPGYFRFDGFSDTGQIIGRQSEKTGQTWYVGTREALTPFRTTPAFQQLTAAGYSLYGLTGLNNAGDVVLNASIKQGAEQAFVARGGALTALKPLAGAGQPECSAAAINSAGAVAGQSQGQAVLWAGGAPQGLGLLPGYPESEATGLNERGMVIGRLYRREEIGVSPFAPGERGHAFVWEGGTMQDLGTLAGYEYTSANGLNDAGQVVGGARSIQPISPEMLKKMTWLPPRKAGDTSHHYNISSRAFLWQRGKMYDLQQCLPKDSPWRLQSACAINNWGQIVALAISDSPRSAGPDVYAVLLTPKTP